MPVRDRSGLIETTTDLKRNGPKSNNLVETLMGYESQPRSEIQT